MIIRAVSIFFVKLITELKILLEQVRMSSMLSSIFSKDIPVPLLSTFNGHTKSINACCFHPNGRFILSASKDCTLKLWDLEGNCLKTLKEHTSPVLACTFSRDGRFFLSASGGGDYHRTTPRDNTIKLWDIYGNCLKIFIGHAEDVNSCVFSPDGQTILSASSDATLKLWNLEGQCLRTFKGHSGSVTACAFNPDGQLILSASYRTLKLWDIKGFCKTLEGHTGSIRACTFSPDGKLILSASEDYTLKLWDIDGKCLITFDGYFHRHSGGVRSCTFSLDGQYILSASGDRTIKLWDLKGNCLKTLKEHTEPLNACTFSPNGQLILSASGYDYSSDEGNLKLWDASAIAKTLLAAPAPVPPSPVSALDISIPLLHNKTFHGHAFTVKACAFSPNGQLILSSSICEAIVWNLEGKRLAVHTYPDWPKTYVHACTFSPDGKYILSASSDATLKLEKIGSIDSKTLKGHNFSVNDCAFSPDGKIILSASDDHTLKLWNLDGRCLKTLEGHTSPVTTCAFSPDGKIIFSHSFMRELKLWDILYIPAEVSH